MKDNALRVVCPSCEAWFEVDDPQLLGQIIPCPKCGGMMLIAAAENDVEAREEAPAEEIGEAKESLESERPEEAAPVAPAVEPRKNVEPAAPVEPDEAGEVDEARAERERRRVSRALAVTFGLFSAVVFAFVLTFIVRYRDTPEVPAPKPQNEAVDEAGGQDVVDVQETATEAPTEPQGEANDAEGETEADVESEGDAAPEGGRDVDSGEEGDEPDAQESETVDESGEGDAKAEDEEPLTDAGLEEELGEGEETDGESWEEEDLNELDESGAPSAEFDKEAFDKANSSQDAEAEEEPSEDDWSEVASTTDISAQTAFPILKSQPKAIDVDARLGLKIKSITFPTSPAASVRLLSELVDAPIEFDLEKFSLLRASTARTLDLKLDDVSAETALDKLAEHLRWKIDKLEDRVVVRSADDDPTPVEERFDVSDLVGLSAPVLFTKELAETTDVKGLGAEKLTVEGALEMANVLAPITGEESAASTSVEGNEIVARRNAIDRKNLELLWERVRAMKNVPSKTSEPVGSIVPEHLGWLTLSRTTSFNLLKPISLQQAIETLENKFRFLALWDDATLNVAGVGRASTTLARINSAALDQVLYDLLEPLKLTYVILDEKLILVTTKEKAETYKTVEILEFSGVTNESKKPKDALKATVDMTSVVAPESWNGDAAIWIDFESERWLVRQSQPVQREIRRWIAEHKTGKSRSNASNERPAESETTPEAQEDEAEPDADAAESDANAETFDLDVELGDEGNGLDEGEER